MKEMLLQELVHLVIVARLGAAFLEMLDPVQTCILQLWGKATLYLDSLYVDCKHAGSARATDVLLE